MILFKYQGAALVPGVAPGSEVDLDGVRWTVTPQGHLEAIVSDPGPEDVLQVTTDLAASVQTDPVIE